MKNDGVHYVLTDIIVRPEKPIALWFAALTRLGCGLVVPETFTREATPEETFKIPSVISGTNRS